MTDVIEKRVVVGPDGTQHTLLSVGLLCEDESLTKQSEAAACDINKIMAKYEKSGLLMHVNANEGFYADVSAVPDYQGALAIVRKSDEMFMSLPAEIRSRFDNDPAKYLAFCSDPANKQVMQDMGMLAKDPVADPSLADQVVDALKAAGVAVPAPAVKV